MINNIQNSEEFRDWKTLKVSRCSEIREFLTSGKSFIFPALLPKNPLDFRALKTQKSFFGNRGFRK